MNTLYKRSELKNMDNTMVPFKNVEGDTIGTAILHYEDNQLVSYGTDKLTGVIIKAIAIPKERIIDDR